MPAVMPDNDVIGHFQILIEICHSEEWRDIWNRLGIGVENMADLGLSANASDREIWTICQQREVVLITGNRNADGPESLESTLRELGTPLSLPVLTISWPRSVYLDREYARRVAVRMIEYLIDLEQFRGTGRNYMPWLRRFLNCRRSMLLGEEDSLDVAA